MKRALGEMREIQTLECELFNFLTPYFIIVEMQDFIMKNPPWSIQQLF